MPADRGAESGSASEERHQAAADERTSLRELALLFLRLGTTAFGGPAAHIAMMHDEVVRRRRWMSEERFLDLLGATNLIPGPNSTEMAIHVGLERRGAMGLAVAGVSFIVPAMLISGTLAWAYVRYGALPEVAWLLYGVKPVVIAIVLQAIWGLAPKAARGFSLKALGAVAAAFAWMGVNELAVLLGAGLVGILGRSKVRDHGNGAPGAWAGIASPLLAWSPRPSTLSGIALACAAAAIRPLSLFWVFVKIGSVLFGSGYVLLAFLRADLVERREWLTEAQLIDAVAVGQLTPGPVFTTATFIGYLLLGVPGALVATAGIFLPAFAFVALSHPVLPRLHSSRIAASFLDGVNVAALALMAVVTVQLGQAAIVDLPAALIGLLSAAVLLLFRPNSTWLVLGGAAAGWCLQAAGWRA